ncbi:imidazolonepropionase [Halogeometricum borinquense]|uniref:Imidazolonepropionase n=1 Tax=Halogeometricum borinquense TaxID=60847 RepID=A0A6C0UK63_9EURY|nr:imidazolonepropionase [Halogeometricum borinquense]QIB74711.1 imidazolonepropionase [Halogeometricum borinquense]QIQ76334.1 imidazolonepropionase [Halogeometricum borinquense]
MIDLLLTNAAEVVTYADHERLDSIEDAAVAIEDGHIVALGPTDEVTSEYPESEAENVLDCAGQAIVPGFVDPHTHALFAGDRSDEFEAKLRGKTYQEILSEGGGILRTVEAVRDASTDELVENLLEQFDVMLAHGTTTAEVKSGYGLDTETELRMLEAIDRAADRHPIRVVTTFMGAHAVPNGTDTDDYVEAVVSEQIPKAAEQGIAEFCDVFCEEGVFDVEQSRRVLEAGKEHGLTPKVHAEELTHLGGTQLAAEVGATSADHLLHATGEDIDALVAADTTPVLLPGTAFGLGAEYADAEMFLEHGAPVALATDLNPNCYSQSMPFAMTLGCVEMGMTPAQALGASTVNAARAIDRAEAGRLETGSPADLAVLDAPSYVHLSYNFGVNSIDTVVIGGEVAHD